MSAHRSSPASRLAVCSALVGCWARCSAAAELPPAAGVARRYPRRSVSGHLGEATMADGYGDILGGFDPYAGQRLAAAMSATLGADPGRLAYSSGPVGQALGQISGGFERARAIDLANTLAGERMAALPDRRGLYRRPPLQRDAVHLAVRAPWPELVPGHRHLRMERRSQHLGRAGKR